MPSLSVTSSFPFFTVAPLHSERSVSTPITQPGPKKLSRNDHAPLNALLGHRVQAR